MLELLLNDDTTKILNKQLFYLQDKINNLYQINNDLSNKYMNSLKNNKLLQNKIKLSEKNLKISNIINNKFIKLNIKNSFNLNNTTTYQFLSVENLINNYNIKYPQFQRKVDESRIKELTKYYINNLKNDIFEFISPLKLINNWVIINICILTIH